MTATTTKKDLFTIENLAGNMFKPGSENAKKVSVKVLWLLQVSLTMDKLKTRRVWKINVKMNSSYFQEKILRAIFTEKIIFFISMTSKEQIYIKKSHKSLLQKLPVHFLKKWKLTQVLNVYFFNIFLWTPLRFHLWTIVTFRLLKRAISKRKPITIDGI